LATLSGGFGSGSGVRADVAVSGSSGVVLGDLEAEVLALGDELAQALVVVEPGSWPTSSRPKVEIPAESSISAVSIERTAHR
jgi:hypothetical protein